MPGKSSTLDIVSRLLVLAQAAEITSPPRPEVVARLALDAAAEIRYLRRRIADLEIRLAGLATQTLRQLQTQN
jgi:hypothetical protein